MARKTKGTWPRFVDTVLWKLQSRAEALIWQRWILFCLGIFLEHILINSFHKICRWQSLLQTATANIDKKLTCVRLLSVVTEYSNVFSTHSHGQNFYRWRDLKKSPDLGLSLGEKPKGKLAINRTKVPGGNVNLFSLCLSSPASQNKS